MTRVDAEPGTILADDAMADAIARTRPRVVAFVHAETSTGVAQPVEAIARAAREAGALVVLDCVTSLGGLPVELDAWGIDAAYSGTQKCLSCPPGLSPASFSEAAVARARARRVPVQSWYLDINLLGAYFGSERVYHHTAPISMILGLAAALEMIEEEGMPARIERHREAGEALVEGILGLRLPAAGRGASPPADAHFAAAARRASRRARRPGCASTCSIATGSRSAAGSGRSPARSGGSA